MFKNNITLSKRLMSLLIDGLILMVICMFLISILLILNLAQNIACRILLLSILFSLFFCKDILFRGQSIGKRNLKLKVQDVSNQKTTLLRLILRNLFIVVWPIEIVLILINPQRRFGDIIFGTKLVSDDTKNTKIYKKEFVGSFTIVLIICLCFFYFVFYVLIPENTIRILYS
ncbi:hypothetical protein FACS1894169_12950 [Bacteroidia bacterium]|nr:hypothetical protein FACS1894169_12950 [Bacteroidia bacterium]